MPTTEPTGNLTGTATWRDPAWLATALDWAREQVGDLDGPPEQRTSDRGRRRSGCRCGAAPSGSSPSAADRRTSRRCWRRWGSGRPTTSSCRSRWIPTGGWSSCPTAARPCARWAGQRSPRRGRRCSAATHSCSSTSSRTPPRCSRSASPTPGPTACPDLVAELLADDDALLAGHPDGIDPEVRARIAADLGRYGDLCRALADGGIPPTLQHDDLHDANVFVADNRYRFFDWGDASVSHPFVSLLVPLRAAAHSLGVDDGHPVLFRLRDAYLDVWRDHGDPGELREQAGLALAVGPLQRALTWRRVLRGVVPAERAEWQDSVPGWTAEHLEPGSLSTG